MELFYLKFPILIHLLNNKAKHLVESFEELPQGHYFKIVRTGLDETDPFNIFTIEGEYTVSEEMPVEKETKIDEQTQENNDAFVADSSDNGASDGSKDSIGTSL